MLDFVPLSSAHPALRLVPHTELSLADVDVLAVPVHPPTGPGTSVTIGSGADLLQSTSSLHDLLQHERATGAAGEVAVAPDGQGRVVLLVGVGDATVDELRIAASALARRLRAGSRVAVTIAARADDIRAAPAVAEAMMTGLHRFPSNRPPADVPAALTIIMNEAGQGEPVRRVQATAAAVAVAQDLTNMPSSLKSPEWLAERAEALAAETGLAAHIFSDGELLRLGFGGILAVGAGSHRRPRMIQLEYRPEHNLPRRHVALVGKGITFDSGGLHLKSLDEMGTMKMDMAGGAAIVGAMTALKQLGVPDRVTAVVPVAENMPGGGAVRPGDVITHFGGSTTEVVDPDAEGRLILADALAYVAHTVKPDVVVDIATLTGATITALGTRRAALYTTSDSLAADLQRASRDAGEKLWRMPLDDCYRDTLESPVADRRNASRADRFYGALAGVAALFLKDFSGGYPWAHLDMAGPAVADSSFHGAAQNATGFGVRTLLEWLSPTVSPIRESDQRT